MKFRPFHQLSNGIKQVKNRHKSSYLFKLNQFVPFLKNGVRGSLHDFATKHFFRSLYTQKTKCRPFKELSIGVK